MYDSTSRGLFRACELFYTVLKHFVCLYHANLPGQIWFTLHVGNTDVSIKGVLFLSEDFICRPTLTYSRIQAWGDTKC